MPTFIIALSLVSFLAPLSLCAATFSFDAPSKILRQEEVLVTVQVDTEDDALNALSGRVNIGTQASVKAIYDGDSAISVWIERPAFDETSNSIVFSGFTPGGLSGKRPVFSFVLHASKAGSVDITLSDMLALKNDGEGSRASATSIRKSISISSHVSTSTVAVTDTVSPEAFSPTVNSFDGAFDGRPFVSFVAQDKGSGIDHYEYTYAYLFPHDESWQKIESPFELERSAFSKRIFIKAVDRLGNERVESVWGPLYYRTVLLWVILSVIVICVLFFTRRFFLRRF